jgi:hypothetical protein
MILEQILTFFGLKEKHKMENIEIFRSVSEIIAFFQRKYPDAMVERSDENSDELGIILKRRDSQSTTFIPIRDSQKSGYFLIEVPKEF